MCHHERDGARIRRRRICPRGSCRRSQQPPPPPSSSSCGRRPGWLSCFTPRRRRPPFPSSHRLRSSSSPRTSAPRRPAQSRPRPPRRRARRRLRGKSRAGSGRASRRTARRASRRPGRPGNRRRRRSDWAGRTGPSCGRAAPRRALSVGRPREGERSRRRRRESSHWLPPPSPSPTQPSSGRHGRRQQQLPPAVVLLPLPVLLQQIRPRLPRARAAALQLLPPRPTVAVAILLWAPLYSPSAERRATAAILVFGEANVNNFDNVGKKARNRRISHLILINEA